MIYIGRFKEFNPNHDFPSIKDSFSPYKYKGQDKISYYLRHGKKDMLSLEIPKDVITGETIRMEKIGMNDGVYTWFNTLAYYVEKYNLRLPEDFEKHVLSSQGHKHKSWEQGK